MSGIAKPMANAISKVLRRLGEMGLLEPIGGVITRLL